MDAEREGRALDAMEALLGLGEALEFCFGVGRVEVRRQKVRIEVVRYRIDCEQVGVGATSYTVLFNDSGVLSDEPSIVDVGEPIDAWPFLGPGLDGTQRVAYVSAGTLHVGPFDPEELTVDEKTSQAAPTEVHWSTAGDFNGDGLRDLALGTDDGAQLYLSVPATPQ